MILKLEIIPHIILQTTDPLLQQSCCLYRLNTRLVRGFSTLLQSEFKPHVAGCSNSQLAFLILFLTLTSFLNATKAILLLLTSIK